MNLLIIHAHNANRGDEAAVTAMVKELRGIYPDAKITISINGYTPYPNLPEDIKQIDRLPKLRSRVAQLEYFIILATKGKVAFTKEGKVFMKALWEADLVLHAPGGPSIGDIYDKPERLYLWRLDLVRRMGIPYMFYAPSMGPFHNPKRSKLRKKVLLGAKRIVLRDPISVKYLKEFLPEVPVEQALDSALQHEVDAEVNEKKLRGYKELMSFLDAHPKCIGVTITDLKWHPKHKTDPMIERIPASFHPFIEKKVEEGYGIVFIPQLYGSGNDTRLMKEYMLKEHTFMVDAFSDVYDAYFQQYLIGKLYAVVGMRYHSNIFSAKMSTPFVSVSYEQKMSGFMRSIDLYDYCVEVAELSSERLQEKFRMLEENHDTYKQQLEALHEYMRTESYKTTKVVQEILEER